MKLDVLNIQGEPTGKTVSLSESSFGVEPNEHVVYLAVKQYLAHQRQGTHKSKERGEVAGSTRKIKRQKGTGTARAGDIKNPIFRGGGRIFGPRPRDYKVKLNKKVKALARKSVLSDKYKAGSIIVVEDFSFDSPKTKEFAGILNNLKVGNNRSLLLTSDLNKTVYLSSRNVPKSKVTTVKEVNTYDVLHAQTLVLSESSVEELNKMFA